jgi:diguanylate cyclase (GGDEF)-like protein
MSPASAAWLPPALQNSWLLNWRTGNRGGPLERGTWQREAAAEVRRAVRLDAPLAVAIIDLDSFTLVNDAYGHVFGDEVLRQVGQCLHAVQREYDLAGRFGGGEFVMLLPQTRSTDALRIAERVRAHIARLPIATPGGEPVTVTASIGVASLDARANKELTELLAAADAALYRAKASGRDQVQMISSSRGLTAVGGAIQDNHASPRLTTRGIRGAADFAPAAVPLGALPSAARLLTVAAQVLPSPDRSRYAEEFRAELQDIACTGNGRRPQLRYAVRQFIAALQLRRELRVPSRHRAAS